MSEDYTGWELVRKIGNQDVYYHKSRDQYAIERDRSYLGGLTQREQDILDGILENELHRDEPDYRERPVGPGVSHALGEVW